MQNPATNDPSRERLLNAAVAIFAERGYREATVRDICAKAEVNQAAINYYFGGKENLYAESLRFAIVEAQHRYPLGVALDPQAPAEQRLANFVEVLLQKLTDEGALGLHGKLIAREIADPTSALDGIIQLAMTPQFDLLRSLVPGLVGRPCGAALIDRCVLSILGQCLCYKHARSVIAKLCPQVTATPEEIARSAEHIVRFSLAALQHLTLDEGDV